MKGIRSKNYLLESVLFCHLLFVICPNYHDFNSYLPFLKIIRKNFILALARFLIVYSADTIGNYDKLQQAIIIYRNLRKKLLSTKKYRKLTPNKILPYSQHPGFLFIHWNFFLKDQFVTDNKMFSFQILWVLWVVRSCLCILIVRRWLPVMSRF